ncbi:MAG: hypothetical protein QGI64_05615 [Desulfobacterales bacterium]|jgi:hypothetical protein|nr:hypothetical protein [Desulfobacterales bacterium]
MDIKEAFGYDVGHTAGAGFALHLPYLKMLQDLFDDSFIFNKDDDLHRSLALGTSKWIIPFASSILFLV